MLFTRLRKFFISSLLSVLPWKGVEFYQMFFHRLLRWSCGFFVLYFIRMDIAVNDFQIITSLYYFSGPLLNENTFEMENFWVKKLLLFTNCFSLSWSSLFFVFFFWKMNPWQWLLPRMCSQEEMQFLMLMANWLSGSPGLIISGCPC